MHTWNHWPHLQATALIHHLQYEMYGKLSPVTTNNLELVPIADGDLLWYSKVIMNIVDLAFRDLTGV